MRIFLKVPDTNNILQRCLPLYGSKESKHNTRLYEKVISKKLMKHMKKEDIF